MKITNAIKKLTKAGFAVTQNGIFWSAKFNNNVISFIDMDERITCINLKNENEIDNVQSDYSAGVFCDNLSQVIRLAN